MRADAKSNRGGRRETRAVVEEAGDGVDGEIRRGDDRSARVICERVHTKNSDIDVSLTIHPSSQWYNEEEEEEV